MFEIVPCVDVLGGRPVRLEGGDPDRATTYYDAPADAAAHWASLGATTVHFVDLDAALERGDNADAIRAAATATPPTPTRPPPRFPSKQSVAVGSLVRTLDLQFEPGVQL